MAQQELRRMRVAVLVKQVPRLEEMALGDDGRLKRSEVDLELNPYCRRAVSKGVELAREHGGECVVVFTLGPPILTRLFSRAATSASSATGERSSRCWPKRSGPR
jgi:electron transfer flavoprotein alpha/beta subunit